MDTIDNLIDYVRVDKSKYDMGCSRYNNLGSTCYMNSILHILQIIPQFKYFIINAKFKMQLKIKLPQDEDEHYEYINNLLIYKLFKLFSKSNKYDDFTLNPKHFYNLLKKKNPFFDNDDHQDSQEFLNFLITKIEEEICIKKKYVLCYNDIPDLSPYDAITCISEFNIWSKFYKNEYSPLKNMFNGQFIINKKCNFCNCISNTYEPFITLPVTIPQTSTKLNIYDCLDELTKTEQLDNDNKMKCHFCGLKTKGYTNTFLWKTPKILVINIKRFIVNNYGIIIQKNNTNIDYPIRDLNLSKYFNKSSPFINKSKYDLLGVNIHLGTINKGHYISYVKNTFNDNWFCYNDSNEPILIQEPDELLDRNAYLLFYYRHN